MNCPVCHLSKTTEFFYSKGVPVHQNLVLSSRVDACNITRGDLSLHLCENCGFVFNSRFDDSLLSYGPSYDNTQVCSPYFSKYVQDMVRYLVEECGIKERKIIEVGCGKGFFLRTLCQLGGNWGIGFDSSYVGPEENLEGRIKYEKRFYGPECADIPADVVICRHVIEHVSDPVGLLKAIREALRNSAHAQVFFETPDLAWIFENEVFWDFFYEHCSYFTKQSLITAFGIAGFQVENIRNVFQGQYLWAEAKLSSRKSHDIRESPGQIPILAKQFVNNQGLLIQHWQECLKELRSLGGVAIWGAGAKGVTFVNLLDPHCEWIDCVVDLNPGKQGKFVPGTGHPIVSYQDLPKRNVVAAILMNPNYREENRSLLQKAGIKLNLVD